MDAENGIPVRSLRPRCGAPRAAPLIAADLDRAAGLRSPCLSHRQSRPDRNARRSPTGGLGRPYRVGIDADIAHIERTRCHWRYRRGSASDPHAAAQGLPVHRRSRRHRSCRAAGRALLNTSRLRSWAAPGSRTRHANHGSRQHLAGALLRGRHRRRDHRGAIAQLTDRHPRRSCW